MAISSTTFNTDNPIYGIPEGASAMCTDHHKPVYAMPNMEEKPYTTKSLANGNINEAKQDGKFECANPTYYVHEQR